MSSSTSSANLANFTIKTWWTTNRTQSRITRMAVGGSLTAVGAAYLDEHAFAAGARGGSDDLARGCGVDVLRREVDDAAQRHERRPVNGTYQGGKPYKKVWQTRYLSVTEKRKALLERSGAVAQEQPVQLNIDFATFCRSPGIVAGVDEGAGVERADARLSGTARAHEVSLGAIIISFASCIAQHFKRHAKPTPFKLTVAF